MSKRTAPTPADDRNAEALPWSAPVRRVVSVVLAFHVAAVFIAPWSNPPPASQLSMTVAGAIRPYLNILNINNGYRFFAPDPPRASHLVRYEVRMRDGTIRQGQFPNINEQWPRQLYHRYFMIAETLNQITDLPPPPPPPRNQDARMYQMMSPREQSRANARWQTEIGRYEEARRFGEGLARSIAESLLAEYDAVSVRLWVVRHFTPSAQDVTDGAMLTDRRFYVERPLGEFRSK